MFYDSGRRSYKMPGWFDPNEVEERTIFFRPPTWEPDTVYYKPSDEDYNIVIPTVFTGLAYKVKYPGKSGSIEPTWIMQEGKETTDGDLGLIWEALNFNNLPITENVVSVVYVATGDVVVVDTEVTDISCTYLIPNLPQQAIDDGRFILTIVAALDNSEQEVLELVYKVKQP